jgi:hypothetical protein
MLRNKSKESKTDPKSTPLSSNNRLIHGTTMHEAKQEREESAWIT